MAVATSVEKQRLSSTEAAARLRRDGPNLLPERPTLPLWRQLTSQLVHFFAVMLWLAGGLAILAGMTQLRIAIFVVIVLNGIFAFIQEYRAERAGEKLRDLLPQRVTVVRDGARLEIGAAELVRGDLALLTAGDRISADLQLIEAHTLAINTSTLTGESVLSTPEAGEWVFAGTFVVEGEGAGVTKAIGNGTRLARIAQLARAGERPPSPLARELNRVVRIIAVVALVAGGIFLTVAWLVGIRFNGALLFAIGVTVALVPEGLLPTVTLSLAIGAERMAARQALVRRLESVETLGSTTFICIDKTGTLTLNEMSVTLVWTAAGWARIAGNGYEPEAAVDAEAGVLSTVRELARAAARGIAGRAVLRDGQWVAQGNPLEAALDVLARRLEIDVAADELAEPTTQRFPFDPRRRRVSLVAGERLLVRGAPEMIFPRCRAIGAANEALTGIAERGLRVLAIAARPIGRLREDVTADEAETDLELLGLVGIEDPPRPGVATAIAACRQAHVLVAMVTGDHPATARAIAELIPFVVWALSGGRFPLALGVLQILSFDVGSDVLPALALGAEPPSYRVLQQRPQGRHLLDSAVLFRAFGVLGPIESMMEIMAFIVAFAAVGWRPGSPFPKGPALLAASGAAFAAVGVGQMANAFACRSTSVWPGTLGWATNRFLLGAVGIEAALLAAFLYLKPLAVILGQKPPGGAGFITALLAFPVVLAADGIHKRWKAMRGAA